MALVDVLPNPQCMPGWTSGWIGVGPTPSSMGTDPDQFNYFEQLYLGNYVAAPEVGIWYGATDSWAIFGNDTEP